MKIGSVKFVGVCEMLYRINFSYTAMKFLNSWPNSLCWLAATRHLGRLKAHFVYPKNVSWLHFSNKILVPSLFIESPSSINGSYCLVGMADKFLKFQFLYILGIDVPWTDSSCLYLEWWCACFGHLSM